MACFFASLVGGTAAAEEAVSIKIETTARREVRFTPKHPPAVEIVNDRLNLAVSSREGMIFQITGIPAATELPERSIKSGEFRALLLHSEFQKEAATDDSFEEASTLTISRTASAGSSQMEFIFSGKLRAGTEILHISLRASARAPVARQFLVPLSTPSKSPQ